LEPELLGRPCPEHAVAPRGRLESELLVVRELLLEAFLALVEGGHGGPRAGAGMDLAYRAVIAKSTAPPPQRRRPVPGRSCAAQPYGRFEPEFRPTIAPSPNATFGFKAALES